MITKISHSLIYVLDLESACDFYTTKIGFAIHTDVLVMRNRWVTLSPPDQPDFQILLMPVDEGMIFKHHQAKKMQELIVEKTLSFGVFECNNLLATYEELKLKGVEFCIEPYKNGYLDEYEAAFFDDSGNWFRLTQKK